MSEENSSNQRIDITLQSAGDEPAPPRQASVRVLRNSDGPYGIAVEVDGLSQIIEVELFEGRVILIARGELQDTHMGDLIMVCEDRPEGAAASDAA